MLSFCTYDPWYFPWEQFSSTQTYYQGDLHSALQPWSRICLCPLQDYVLKHGRHVLLIISLQNFFLNKMLQYYVYLYIANCLFLNIANCLSYCTIFSYTVNLFKVIFICTSFWHVHVNQILAWGLYSFSFSIEVKSINKN